jgi:hypothetical protein
MTISVPSAVLIAILPCNHPDASERFYNRLGFITGPRPSGEE